MPRRIRLPPLSVAALLPLVTSFSPSTATIGANDNRHPAGMLGAHELRLTLELRRGEWYPDADGGPHVTVEAFAEAGRPLVIPSPLIRVPVGTTLHIVIRNTLRDSTLILHGLHSRPGDDDTVQVAPGAARELRFPAGEPGTYHYWGTTSHRSLEARSDDDSQLGGAFIIDPPGPARPDRVFVIGNWYRDPDSTVRPVREAQDIMVINGKEWPHTERFDLAVGDSVRWRWINTTANAHPMHLHGFYFNVESRSDGNRDTVYAPAMRPQVVTELVLPGAAMTMSWVPSRPGNWIFHCHFAFHVSPYVSLAGSRAVDDSLHHLKAAHAMYGLVLGLRVADTGRRVASAAGPARSIRLVAESTAGHFAGNVSYAYVVQDGSEPSSGAPRIPGPVLTLERGRPVSVTVVNHLSMPTAVHWHGIELESGADGVPDWSGTPGRLMRPIAPGDSFIARFTPPRAGTFIYHAHADDVVQLAGGLYGALIVTEPGRPTDPHDRIVLVSLNGESGSSNGGLVNGSAAPAPIELEAGVRHRLRLINIDADDRVLFVLARGTTPVTWRAVAKDGAELPPPQATTRTAQLLTGTGETADFEVEFPHPDSLTLRLSAPYTLKPWTMSVPVIVR